MSEQAVEKKKLTATQKTILAGAAVVVAILAVGGLLLSRMGGSPAPASTGPASGSVVIDDQNFNDVIAELRRKAEEGMFEVKMNNVWTFPDGTSPTPDAYVANSSANHRPFYFTLTLRETGELLYTSPEIPLGSAVKEFRLDKPLPAGNYECVCTYRMMEDGAEIEDSASVVVRIKILR